MKFILGFLVSSVFWFAIFSLKVNEPDGMIDSIKGAVCEANSTLFIALHEIIGDPFALAEKE